MGGIASGGAATYFVPWEFVPDTESAPPGDIIVFWFPTGPENAENSSMRESRELVTWSGKCVGVGLVPDSNSDLRSRFKAPSDEPTAVIVTRDGDVLGRVGATKGRIRVSQVEKLVGNELSARNRTLKELLKNAKLHQKEGDEDKRRQTLRSDHRGQLPLPFDGKEGREGAEEDGP